MSKPTCRWRNVAFVLLPLSFLVVAGALIAWRAADPSDGTAVNVGDTALSASGVVVLEAAPGSPLRVGDEIVAIAGTVVADRLSSGIGGPPLEEGHTIGYDVLRDGQRITLDVPLHAYPLGASIAREWPSVLVTALLMITSGAIYRARPADPAARAAVTASAIGVAAVAGSGYFQLEAIDLVAGSQFWRWFSGEATFGLLWAGMLHFALAFPEVGDPARYRRRVLIGYSAPLALYLGLATIGWLTLSHPVERFAVVGSPALGALYTFPFLVVGVLVWTYVRNSDALLRRRLRWLATSLGGGSMIYLTIWIVPTAFGGAPLLPMKYQTLAFLAVPIAVALAIVRHRALNIEVVFSRSLVYGTLSAGLIAVYVGVVSLLNVLFPPMERLWQQAAAAAIIAIAVRPLHQTLQSLINRRLFGEPDDPYRLVSSLASRLETIGTPEEQLPIMVETIGTALRLPYVAIELQRETGSEKVAGFGQPTTSTIRMPLTHQRELVGHLVVARRGRWDVAGKKERAVLADVARHAGTIVHTTRLTMDLVRMRDRLVRAREEERRRLLRDLHDGIGPTLAAVGFGLHATRRAIGETAPAAPMLSRLQEALNGATTEVRRLAHNLRPPALDKLGLLEATREYLDIGGDMADVAANRPSSHDLRIELDAPDQLPPLTPATDVAAYRIICEAVTNVRRHSRARHCTVRLSANDGLHISVIDDGIGLHGDNGSGIGLSSMRERAAELGGTCSIEQSSKRGSAIHVVLPLRKEFLNGNGNGSHEQ